MDKGQSYRAGVEDIALAKFTCGELSYCHNTNLIFSYELQLKW